MVNDLRNVRSTNWYIEETFFLLLISSSTIFPTILAFSSSLTQKILHLSQLSALPTPHHSQIHRNPHQHASVTVGGYSL